MTEISIKNHFEKSFNTILCVFLSASLERQKQKNIAFSGLDFMLIIFASFILLICVWIMIRGRMHYNAFGR